MRTISLLALLALTACGEGDFSRPGTWQATGINDRNLQAMLADPSHAARGVSAPDERGEAGSAPIDRLLRNARTPLPAQGTEITITPPAPAAPPAPGGTNGR